MSCQVGARCELHGLIAWMPDSGSTLISKQIPFGGKKTVSISQRRSPATDGICLESTSEGCLRKTFRSREATVWHPGYGLKVQTDVLQTTSRPEFTFPPSSVRNDGAQTITVGLESLGACLGLSHRTFNDYSYERPRVHQPSGTAGNKQTFPPGARRFLQTFGPSKTD
ncbi:hypothetical protein Bbelb_231460 [Branchiostoma belcheri]|nr:hypothetical protein Bbelb_231460 [Branchiostoma belcheri]